MVMVTMKRRRERRRLIEQARADAAESRRIRERLAAQWPEIDRMAGTSERHVRENHVREKLRAVFATPRRHARGRWLG